jgi:magnesium chelatase subunit D
VSAVADPAWTRALLVARLFAGDPHGFGGVRLAGPPGPVRERWLAELRAHLPAGMPLRRVPPRIPDERLLGGLDLEATLARGAPVARRGLLAESDGGIVLLAMAETLGSATAAKLCAVLDQGETRAERDGVRLSAQARIGAVALDEAEPDEPGLAASLRERFAFDVDLSALRIADAPRTEPCPQISRAASCVADDDIVASICLTAAALGVDSPRASIFALRAARALAAIEGRARVDAADAATAAELVLAPRATCIPATQPPPDQPSEAPTPPPEGSADDDTRDDDHTPPLDDQVLAAALAAMPPGLLARLGAGAAGRVRSAGRSGDMGKAGARGRPAGTIAGDPRRMGARLDLVATLRAAAPWQRLRAGDLKAAGIVRVRPSDFRVRRFKPRTTSTTIFAIDASGSSALHRMAEAKGAVELMLAECYVRRDRVAVLAFRGRGSDLVLPPTRSLVRAKRALAGLPGGGGTPLAAALDAATEIAIAIRRQGGTPNIVLLTDGRANVARDGTGGRDLAIAQAVDAAKTIRSLGMRAIVVDTAVRPSPPARALGEAMGALYLPLPQADARALDRAIKAGLG